MPKKSRGHHLFIFISTLVVVFLAVSLSSPAKPTTWDVYSDWDRSLIQATIDGASNGDTIYFHAGEYDWSSDWTPATLPHRWENTGALVIKDITLTLRGEAGTLLLGPDSINGTGDALGVNAFRIIDLDTNNDVTFDRLSFRNFLRGIASGYLSYRDPAANVEILAPNLRNLTIKNCTFTDMHRQSVTISVIGGNVLVQNCDLSGAYMGLYAGWYWSAGHTAWQPKDTYIRILDNKVASLQIGLCFNQTTNVIIMNNRISCPIGIDTQGTNNGAVISGNSISNCLDGIEIYGANGAVVERNELKNVAEYGIRLWDADCHGNIVSKNSLEMVETSWGGIVSNANNNYYGQNKIRGTGGSAFYLYRNRAGSAYKETLQANNVDNFMPTYCHFYLGPLTHDNLIIGSGMDHNTYIDLGFNNRITGATPLPGGIGQDLIDAIRLRNEELKEARPIIY